MYPEDLKYHKEHTWVKVDGNKVTMGITDYAAETLGDIVYIDEVETDSSVESGSELTQIESTKATSPVICPVRGTIVEYNENLNDEPEIINEAPYENGWIVKIELESESELDGLMDPADYEKFVDEVKHK